MKIGIVTWYKNGNFGGTLQAFAMQQVYKKIGCTVEFINFTKGVSPFWYKCKTKNKTIALYFIDKNLYKTRVLLHKFVRRMLIETKTISSYKKLQEYCNKFDAVSCGSDQIWSIRSNASKIDSYYFLSFVPEYKRIAYAPSIGLLDIPKNHQKQFSNLVNSIPFLSIREKYGADLIRRYSGREASIVLDPCFLLSTQEWNQFIEPDPLVEGDYVLSYFLAKKRSYVNFVERISTKFFLKKIYVQIKRQGVTSEEIYPVSPFDFIRLIRDARYVLTDSFHGLVFSLIFHKQVGVFYRFKDSDVLNQNSRINNLVEMFNLKKIIVDGSEDSIEKFNVASNIIDYKYVDSVLKREKKKSYNFLLNAINEISDK